MTFGFGNQHSIQLSYGRAAGILPRAANERPATVTRLRRHGIISRSSDPTARPARHRTRNAMSDHSTSPIKNWKQLVVVVVAAFVIPIALIVLISQRLRRRQARVRRRPRGAQPDQAGRRDRARRGRWSQGRATGDQVYEQVCKACHENGLAGAHKIGDKAAWAKVVAQGPKLTYEHAIKGIRAMPAKGGNPNLEDVEVQRAVAFMVNKAGAGWMEPAGPAAIARPAPPLEGRTGEQVVAAACGKCHQTGQGGAPKIGDRTAWTSRLKLGLEPVVKSAINGHAGMPARGGLADLTDAEVKRAVEFMMNSGAAACRRCSRGSSGGRRRRTGRRRRRQEGLRHRVHRLPRHRRRRRAEVRRQGRLGAAAQDRDGRVVHGGAQGQGRNARQGRQRRAIRCRGEGQRRLHDGGGEVTVVCRRGAVAQDSQRPVSPLFRPTVSPRTACQPRPGRSSALSGSGWCRGSRHPNRPLGKR